MSPSEVEEGRRVLVYPDPAKVATPYFDGITSNSDEFSFVPWSPKQALVGDYDLVHIHWPESVWGQESTAKATLRGSVLLGLLLGARVRKRPVVYTLHNLEPHEVPHSRLHRLFQGVFDRFVKRVQVLSEHGRQAAAERFGERIGADLVRIGIDHLDHAQLSDPQASKSPPMVLHFGFIRRYKNVTTLVSEFTKLDTRTDWRLSVVGKTSDRELESEIRAEASKSDRVDLRLEFIDEAEISQIHQLASLAVFPYLTIENSSSIMTALQYGIPVLAPALGALPELQTVVGPEWLNLYEGPFSSSLLDEAMDWAIRTIRTDPPAVDAYEWPLVRQERDRSYELALGSVS